jgi:hypothetical protein
MSSGGTEPQGGNAAAGEAATGGTAGGSASVPTEKTPTVLILLDGTGTMYEPREKGWGAVFDALVGDEGLIDEFGDRVRFGLSVFRGSVVSIPDESDPLCSELHNVDFAFENKDAIRTRLELLEQDYVPGMRWDNPIGNIVTRSAEALLADPAPGTKHIVFFTDSDPNTCAMVDPQCGQDQAIHAVQEAYDAGVFFYAIGVGEMASGPGCDPAWARCAELFIADMSSAGQGHPVTAPPESYIYQPCADVAGRMLFAEYAIAGSPLPGVIGESAEEVRMYVRSALERVLQIAGS